MNFLLKLLLLAFIIAKIMGIVSWSWWIVLIPLYLIIGINTFLIIILMLFKDYYYSIHPDKNVAYANWQKAMEVSRLKISKNEKVQSIKDILNNGLNVKDKI